MDGRRLFGTVLGTIFVLSASAAAVWGQNDPAADRSVTASAEDSLSLSFEAATDTSPCAGCGQPCGCPRWTASAEFIGLNRLGGVNQTLVSTYPPHDPIVLGTGTERLNSNDLSQGFAAGSRILVRQSNDRYDLEFSFFEINGWSSARSIQPDGIGEPDAPPPNWLVFAAPGDFIQTTDYADQAMAWDYATKLYNAEVNVRWELCSRVTMLAGFRWVNLREDLLGTLPPERAMPFWDTKTRNNLYGFQVGEDWKILNRGRFSIDGLVKAGLFDNNAQEATGVSIYRTMYWESASRNRLAFLGEIGVEGKFQLTKRLLLKGGYEAIWLQGVGLAPAQIRYTLSHGTPVTDVYVESLGFDTSSGVLFHGATAGLEYAF